MALSRALSNEKHLLMGVARELGNNRAGGVNYIIERPAEDGPPEVIRIVDSGKAPNLPICISSDEEEEGEVVDEGEGIPPLPSDDEDAFEELMVMVEAGDEDTDDDEDWSDSGDSAYDSTCEDEEDLEDDYDDDNIRPRSTLIQRFPPENFLQGWRQVYPPEQQVEQPEDGLPSVFQRLEESAPSTSGHSSSTNRSTEDSYGEQVSVKRQRWNCVGSHEESAASTSSLSSFTNRSRKESYWESAPSASGLGSFANRKYWPGPFECSRWADDSDSD
ncbi:uncharacterized protein LOC122862826 [Siniperca chuatsi]|uniref:uncharacterized protein LOC122862826 n=1 Tax=Siniperca chuatsi TaxID=119488 RepID=UPI001CE11550|nr:uncharacterized protein LOC122862826 [Siniperca chuatsi]XP_044024494.1 uncharacterized protein LOC122862826 [Siniperca chuatsi]XP_044024495.1 uncharacterized protein LOC122862826 [Siniperca chuatsi]